MEILIVHELPRRLRLRLQIPRQVSFNYAGLEEKLQTVKGIEKTSFNPRLGTLLVRHNGIGQFKERLLNCIREYFPFSISVRKASDIPQAAALEATQPTLRKILVKGGILAVAPWIPAPLLMAMTWSNVVPRITKGADSIMKKHLDTDVFDSLALAAVWKVRGLRSAGKLSYLMLIREYMAARAQPSSPVLLTRDSQT